MPVIKMNLVIVQGGSLNRPDNRQSKTESVACFKVDSAAMQGKVCNNESAPANPGDDLVVNSVVVLMSVNSHRLVACIMNSRMECFDV